MPKLEIRMVSGNDDKVTIEDERSALVGIVNSLGENINVTLNKPDGGVFLIKHAAVVTATITP